jgi:hypothetical protein
MNSLQRAKQQTLEAQSALAKQKQNLAMQIQRDADRQRAMMAAEDAYRSYGPVSSSEVLGRETEALSPAKYQVAPAMPQNTVMTIKSDIAAPLKTDAAGRLGTAQYSFTGRKYGPIVQRKEVLSQPNIVQKIVGWVKGVVSPAKTDLVTPHMRRVTVVSPLKNIQARFAQQAKIIEAARSRSYIHKWGDWAITYKRGRPIIPPRSITAGAPGLASSHGTFRTVAPMQARR